MPVKYVPFYPNTVQGQAILDNITRTRRVLRYRDNNKVYERIQRGIPYYELEKIEEIYPQMTQIPADAEKNNRRESAQSMDKNLLIRGECISACAYLKDKGIQVDLAYIDPPFASGADYAKKVYLRRNPKIAEEIAKAEEELDLEELRAFEEKMYGDIWNKEDYLNWMYENLTAIKSVMSEAASIYVHLDWHIGHYVKILMDEVFGEDNFRNEIIWYYRRWTASSGNFQKMHDTLYYYTKSESLTFNKTFIEPTEGQKKKHNKGWDRNTAFIGGKRRPQLIVYDKEKVEELVDNGNIDINEFARVVFVDVNETSAPDVWEINFINSQSDESADYATQKPEALLTRIINASSNEGMLVADFFGGSGVTAKVAHDLNRKFIHCDVGVNSIQTTRDRLIAAGAEFDIFDIQDGVSLFRNPVQTMDKLKSLITGLKNEDDLDSFWEGGIQDSKLGLVPVYIPNLLDHSTKVLDIPLINRIINEAMPDLPEGTKQVIVFYVDIENETELKNFIHEYNLTNIEIVLRDLKSILDDVVINDEISYQMKETWPGVEIEITSFTSDRLIQKIDAYNQKKSLSRAKNGLFDEKIEDHLRESASSADKNKFAPIAISRNGLELIEFISLDCTNKDGVWKSDFELKIDKNGLVISNGKKTKEFWDAKIVFEKRPLRMKVRNIAGDESIVTIE